ncbi:MHYT domain-containing protein [Streptomyces termitum]|uniref:Membrane protein n=1 Tax=Streptomyces termitum TaxID=67368 RepID=A0A918T6B1_9ACTN|nr:MHYT domain-containing protein [Streptomyces termitum]GHB02749.1 membrane protein [Streptomyces termitum]
MQGTIDGFSYGMVTPLVGYVMACLGSALGLRCTVRSLVTGRTRKPGWLALGAASIGCGIWTMHFIAMLGFQVREATISYDMTLTFLSLLVAVVVVGAGVFTVGYRGAGPVPLGAAGLFTGLGVAGMHYLGMAAMRMNGTMTYAPGTVALSILIAVVAATAALWAAVSVRGFGASLGASVIMGIAVTGMHYTGMAAVGVQVDHSAHAVSTSAATTIFDVLPLLVGPLVFLVLAAAIVMFDPMLIMGDEETTARPVQRIDIGDIQATLNADNNWGAPSATGYPGQEQPRR